MFFSGNTTEKKLSFAMFVVVFIMYSLVCMTKQCFNAAMADIVNEGVLTKSQTGLIISAFYIVYAPTQLIGGFAADRYDSERLILIGLIGAAAANIIIFFSQSYYVMLAAWSFDALVQFGLWTSILKILMSELHSSLRHSAVAYIAIAQPLGAVLAYVTASLIREWRYNFAVSALILILASVFFKIAYKSIKKRMDDVEGHETHSAQWVSHKTKPLKNSSMIFGSGLIFIATMMMLREMVGSGIKGLSPVMLMESYDSITPAVGNALNVIIILFGTVGVISAGMIHHHNRHKDVLILTVILLLAVPGLSVIAFIGKINILMCVFALAWLHGLMMACATIINCWGMRYRIFGREGTVAGIINSAASIGIMIESYGFCALADKAGWTSVVYTWIIMLVLCEVMLVLAATHWSGFCKNMRCSPTAH
ncbi:MAG: MFS transporter [Clostridia bacterium]|nr:MFS transporter [Clostridia bacterium]